MSFYITYRQEKKRIVQSVIIDCRVALGLATANGNVIQPYVNTKVTEIGDNPLYVIENSNGSLAGYFSLTISGNVATLQQANFRPQYSASFTLFYSMINNFISSNEWQYDFL